MNSGANWVGGVAPVATDSLFFGGTTGLTPNNNFAASTAFAGITFNAGAGAFVIAGNEINLTAGVTNNSANAQTISANLNHTANRFHNAATADLIYTGQVKSSRINKEGANTIWLMGALDNSSLGCNLTNGTVILAKNSASNVRALGGVTIVNTNGILRVYGPGTDQIQFGQKVTMSGGVFQVANTNGLTLNTTSEEINALTGIGATSIVENGLANSTNTLVIGGGFGGARGIYGGIIRDGAGVFNLRIYRPGNINTFNGSHTYSGTTQVQVQNNDGTGANTRMIMNGTHVGGGDYTISSSQADRPAALGGTGIISATVANFNALASLSPGGALASDANNSVFSDTTGILTFSNAVNLTTATTTLDVQLNGTTAGSGYDQVVIAGSGSFSNNNANLKLTLGFTPATGNKFTIVKVAGTDSGTNVGIFATLNGVATDLSQGATFVDPGSGKNIRISYRAEGSTFDAGAGLGNDIMLEVLAAPGANLVWRGDVNNSWDVTTTANWRNGGVASTFNNADFVTFNDSGSNNVPLDLTTSLTPASFLFDATKDYVLAGAGKFTGTVILTKTNTGTLSIVTDNDNLGSTTIQQGAIRVGTNGTTGTISGNVTVNTNGTLIHSRADDVTLATTLNGTGSLLHTGAGALILSANSPFSGRITNSGGVLQLGTGVGIAGSINGDVNVSGTNVLRYYYGGNATISNTKSGNGTALYESGGAAIITYNLPATVTNINFTGSNYIGAGLHMKTADPNPGYAFGNGGNVTVADLAQVHLDSTSVPINQEFFIQGNGWPGDATPLGAIRIYNCTVSGPVHLLANTRIGGSINGGTIIGKMDGAFQLEVLGTATNFTLALGPTNGPNTYGSTLVTSGSIRALNSGGISAGPLTVDLIGVVHTFGNNVTVASLNNGPGGGGAIYNMSTATNGTLTVGTDDSSTSFDGVFANGASQPLGLTKVGTGTLTLSAANGNTGNVTVNGGTLALTGSGSFNNAANLQVATGAVLDVTARGDGTLTLSASQTLKHSGSSVGPISVNGNVTVGSGVVLLGLNKANSPATNDTLVVSGALTAGGTLVVTNLGPVLAVGNSFTLFPAAVSGFSSVNLPTTDVANNVIYTWNNTLASDGKITVASVTPLVNTNAPNLQGSVSGNTLSLAWPTNAGWTLLTNSVDLTVTNQWFPYPNSANLTNVNITIDPSKTNVFFKMQYPYP